MCLANVKFALEKTNEGYIGYGYKAVYDNGKGILTGTDRGGIISKKGWMKAKCPELRSESTNSTPYIGGFHIFLTERAAREYCGGTTIIKVKFRKVLAFGSNFTCSRNAACIIAEEMKFDSIVPKV